MTTCDLDRAVADGRLDAIDVGFPVGHEVLADVVEVGGGVTAVRPGDRVAVAFQVSCGTCASCRGGRTAWCSSVPPRPCSVSATAPGRTAAHWPTP